MNLSPGTKLGPYEILSPLGAGGMGEVYRARDTRLGREVAVKVLPQHLSSNPEVRARFEREAKTVSSLNHPHICVLHDVGREGDTDYLVMELVEGETLAAKLARGALSVAEVLKIGAEIAEALDRAHRAGVIHRDLKPGNVMLTKSGAKLMDFGLARATGLAGVSTDGTTAPTQSHTIAQPLTAEGTIVGTFQYMSPEQLDGREADARSDLWALGCVLYEMTTGKRAFDGSTQASLISSIMRDTPRAMSELLPMSPPALERVVVQCLAKDPDDRWQSAGDLRRELEWIRGGSTHGATAPATGAKPVTRRSGHAWPLVTAGLAALVLALVASIVMQRPETAPLTRLQLLSPDPQTDIGDPGNYAVSPAGDAVVFVLADSAGVRRLYVRPLDATEARVIAGTENAWWPMWSPDGRDLAFFADGRLRRVPASGGAIQNLCAAPEPRGGSWGKAGVIVFCPDPRSVLYAIDASGGPPRVATTIDTTTAVRSHRFPTFLPDGRHFVFGAQGGVQAYLTSAFVASLDDPTPRPLAGVGSDVTFAAPDFVLFMRDKALMAQRINLGSLALKGTPILLEERARAYGSYTGSPVASGSQSGVLVYSTPDTRRRSLRWVDFDGRVTPIHSGVPGEQGPVLSPDGRRVVLTAQVPEGNANWLLDLASNRLAQFATVGKGVAYPVWHPAGTRVAGLLGGSIDNPLVEVDPDNGASSPYLKQDASWRLPTSWSEDGRVLVYLEMRPGRLRDLCYLTLDGAPEAHDYLSTPANEDGGKLSPDGKWIAYWTDASGQNVLVVDRFPVPVKARRVASGLATAGIATSADYAHWWGSSGRELYYAGVDGYSIYAVSIPDDPALSPGTPQFVVRLPEGTTGGDFDPAGRRFLVIGPDGPPAWTLTIVHNWTRQLEDRK